MGFELDIIRSIGHSLPPVPHITAVINRVLKPFYLRKPRARVTADVRGAKMTLDPREAVDGGLLFYPHLYDHQEIAFLKKHLTCGSIFLDIGAYIGFYALQAAQIVGETGVCVAVEADPYNFSILKENIQLNSFSNVRALHLGVADHTGILKLGINLRGNRGGNSFLVKYPQETAVSCRSLYEIISQEKLPRIDGAKFDIEGYEYIVLKKFFSEAPLKMHPQFLILEHNPEWLSQMGGNAVELVKTNGYQLYRRCFRNYIFVKK